MSRHRNVRSMRYSDEYDGYDDEYGHSVEDDNCISPSDAAFMYDRSSQQQQLSSYVRTEDDIAEEDEPLTQEYFPNNLNELDRVKLMSCLEEVRNVLGDSLPEQTIIEAITNSNFDIAVALDRLLNSPNIGKKEQVVDSPKPQRTNVRLRGRGGRTSNSLKKHIPIGEINERNSDNNVHSYFDVKKFLECDKKNIEFNLFNAIIVRKEKPDSKINSVAEKTASDSLGLHDDLESDNEEIANMFVLRNMSVDELQKVGPSMFGYFVCKKLIEFNSHCVGLMGKSNIPSKITPFDFKSQSPDDMGLSNRRWKN